MKVKRINMMKATIAVIIASGVSAALHVLWPILIVILVLMFKLV